MEVSQALFHPILQRFSWQKPVRTSARQALSFDKHWRGKAKDRSPTCKFESYLRWRASDTLNRCGGRL